MAPDRGGSRASAGDDAVYADTPDDELAHETSRSIAQEPIGQEPDAAFLRKRSEQPQFTVRALVVGLVIGVLIAFSNTYFGLQTGWISGMAMPSALIGFAYFRGLRTLMCRLGEPMQRWGWGEGFSEVENVLVQTVAGSVGTMPLGCGFVGVVPALEYLLRPEETPESVSSDADIVSALALAEETGGLRLPLGKLILWALGLCFFGVMFAVPLRKEVIVREKLRFPSGTATALMIGVLHGGEKTGAEGGVGAQTARRRKSSRNSADDEESQSLIGNANASSEIPERTDSSDRDCEDDGKNDAMKRDWKKQIRLLTWSFGVSGGYVRIAYISYANEDSLLMHADTPIILCSSSAQYSDPRHLSCRHLALESQPIARLHRSRYYHGPCYYHPHASRCHSGLGRLVACGEVQRLGFRRCWRLEYWQQRLDCLGLSRHHVGGRHRQSRLACAPTDHLVHSHIRSSYGADCTRERLATAAEKSSKPYHTRLQPCGPQRSSR